MSEKKWTPGPWFVRANEFGWTIDTGGLRSPVRAASRYDDDGAPLAAAVMDAPDAHLIAAAPDLYEALAAFVAAMRIYGREAPATITPGEDALFKAEDSARKALAKALSPQEMKE